MENYSSPPTSSLSSAFKSSFEMGGIGFPSTPSIFSSILLLLALIFFFSGRKRSNKNPLPPGPKPWPFFGCLPQMLLNKPVFRWIHKLMDQMNTEIACIRLANIHVITVTSPELACEFLKKQDAIFASRPECMAADLTSAGYLTAALGPLSEQWKKMRRILAAEVFCTARHRWLHDKRVEEADNLVRYVLNHCENEVTGGLVNVRVAAQHYCGNVIRKMIFGVRYFGEGKEDGGPGVEEEEHVNGCFVILAYLYSFCISDYISFFRRFDLDGHEKVIKKAIESVRKFQDPLIDQRIREWVEGTKKEETDLLDVLITVKGVDGEPMLNAEEIKAQIVEIMIATVDNPSNAVEWALAEMINQPHMLRRAQEELDRVVGQNRLVQESDIPELNYVKACAREAFRLHPIAPFNVPHVSVSDATVAGYFIPKGSHVLLSRPGLGRNPKVWDEPLKFKPERHLRDDGARVALSAPDLSMLSFSTGRRGCAGVNLGSVITTMLLARLLQGFTWSVPSTVSRVDLTESARDLFLAKPLIALAKPRLDKNVYPAA